MKAWIADDYGHPSRLRLGELETASVGADEVLVRMPAPAGVFSDRDVFRERADAIVRQPRIAAKGTGRGAVPSRTFRSWR